MLKFYQKFVIGILISSSLFVLNFFLLSIKNIPTDVIIATRTLSVVIGGIYFTIIISEGIREVLERKSTKPTTVVVVPNIIKYLSFHRSPNSLRRNFC